MSPSLILSVSLQYFQLKKELTFLCYPDWYLLK